MAELDAQLRLDIDQALRDVNEIERALDRAIAPIEIEVDDRQALQLESTLREVERIANRAATETSAIDLAAGRAEANFEDLARALDLSEDEARRLSTQILEAQAAANRLEDSARDVARQLGLSEAEARRFVDQLQRADRAADDINTSTGTLATSFGGIRTAAAGIGAALAAIGGAQIFGAAIRGANTAIQTFAQLEDSVNAVNVLFGEGAESVLAFGETAAQSAGLSELAFNQAVAPIGGLLRNFGLSAEEAARASVELVQRGADLASVYGGTVPDALLAINSALVGQVEPLRRYSAEISQARVETFALANNLLQAGEEMTTSVAIQARLGLILQDTNVVAGDFVRTSDDLANAQRTAAGEVENFASEVGESLAPALEEIVALLPEVLEGVRQLIPAFSGGAGSVAEFFEARGEGGGFRTEFAAIEAGFEAVTSGGGVATDVVQSLSSVLRRDFLGAFEQVQQLSRGVEDALTAAVPVQFANDLDRGVDAVTAFNRAIGNTAQLSTNLDLFTDSYRGFAVAGNLSVTQLRAATIELIRNANVLGLTADEVAFLNGELAQLSVELVGSSEEIRAQGFLLAQMETVTAPVVSAFDQLGFAADAAGVSMAELVFSGDPLADALFNALDPADQLALKLEAVSTGALDAGAAFRDTLVPSLIDAADAVIDFNEDGTVSLDEFIQGLEDTALAALNFRTNMAAILAVSPETFAALAALPQEVAAALAEAAVSEGRIAELEVAVVGDPAELEAEFRRIVAQAVQIFNSQGPEAAGQFALGLPVLFEAPELAAEIVGLVNTATTASKARIDNLIESVLTQTEAADRAGETTISVYDQSLTRRLAEADLANNPFIRNLLEEALSQTEAAEIGATETADSFLFTLNQTLDAGIDAVDFFGKGVESITAYYQGLGSVPSGTVGELADSISGTLNAASNAHSPPRLFVDAGIEAGAAYWSGFEQADLQLRIPTPAFTGSMTAGTSQAAGVGGGVEVNFNLPALDTRDADVTIARAGQIGGAVAGILNGRFHL